MQGFLNLNKPGGMTSHDCVARVRRLLRIKRVGHGGTLDPAATGVLPIALGNATRLLQFMRQDKAYRATIRLGIRTATDDLEGDTLTVQVAQDLSLEQVKAALAQFVGEIEQVPPAYSAIQVQGKRLYDLARAGESVEVPARKVQVYKIEVLDWRGGDFPEIDAAIACGPGTYIRAIARDLGEAIAFGGTLAALTRTASCGFTLTDSLTFDDLEAQLQQGIFQPVPVEASLSHIRAVTLTAPEARRWCQGQKILDFQVSILDLQPDRSLELVESEVNLQPDLLKSQMPNPNSIVRVRREDGQFLGIGQLSHSETEPLLIPQVVFNSIQ